MNEKETVKTSKFLRLILRREPERVGLKLGEAGVGKRGINERCDVFAKLSAVSTNVRDAIIRPSLRDLDLVGAIPSVETLGYCRAVPPGLMFACISNEAPLGFIEFPT